MSGRPKHYSDEELIDRATDVFWQKGYTAASAQDLMKAMDIGQGSFYRSFPGGKKELYQKSLSHFLQNSIETFYEDLDICQDPLQFIKDFFYTVAERSTQEKMNGCYLGNAIVESSNLEEDTKSLSSELLSKLKDGFEKALTDAQKMGKLDAQKSPSFLAFHLINFWNGLNVTQRMDPNSRDFKSLIDLNLQVLS